MKSPSKTLSGTAGDAYFDHIYIQSGTLSEIEQVIFITNQVINTFVLQFRLIPHSFVRRGSPVTPGQLTKRSKLKHGIKTFRVQCLYKQSPSSSTGALGIRVGVAVLGRGEGQHKGRGEVAGCGRHRDCL